MNRFRLLVLNEFKLARTALPVHLVAILQPTLMYLLMTEVLVFATFDMYVAQPTTEHLWLSPRACARLETGLQLAIWE